MEERIQRWIDQLRDGKVPEPAGLDVDYESVRLVSSVLLDMGYKNIGTRFPTAKYSGRGRHLNSKNSYTDYDSPDGDIPRIRVTLSRLHGGGNRWRGQLFAKEMKDR